MNLLSLECRVPEFSLSQQEMLAALQACRAWPELRPGSHAILHRVLSGDSGIGRRFFANADLDFLHGADGGELCGLFERAAPALAHGALSAALDSAKCLPGDIDALLVCTCTGYLCPGLASYVAERAGLDASVRLVDVAGQGCGAAIPLLALADSLVRSGARRVACVAVELSSAAFFLDDDVGVLISLCLFGDGAAACVCSPAGEGATPLARLGDFRSLHLPGSREDLRFVNSGGKLKNILRPSVPELVAEAVGKIFPELQSTDGFQTLLAHPGGRKVLEALRGSFPNARLEHSAAVLRDFGNMSSPSVLFVLRRWLDESSEKGAWATAYGAGFTAHGFGVGR